MNTIESTGRRLRASAPGKLMLMGEHAVLRGRLALVCAVDQRISVELKPRRDREVTIQSMLGRHRCDLDTLTVQEPFEFVLGVLVRYGARLPSGFELTIESQFPDTVGLGSSAAVTAATTAVVHAWLRESNDKRVVFEDSWSVIREIQGKASGADVAASVYGGIVGFRMSPLEIIELDGLYPITVVCSGTKAKTTEVITAVEDRHRRAPDRFEFLFDVMDRASQDAVEAIRNGVWAEVGLTMTIGQDVMQGLGVSNDTLDAIVGALRDDPGILGAKISGAGSGDCVVGLGTVKNPGFGYERLPIQMDSQGVIVELGVVR